MRRATTTALALLALGPAPALAQQPGGDGAAGPGEPAWPPAEALSRRVRATLAERWAVDAGRVRIQWAPFPEDHAPAPDASFQLRGAGPGGLWLVDFAATPGAGPARARVRAGIEARRPVAARPLARGITLTDSDVAYATMTEWGPPGRSMAPAGPGWTTRRPIAEGEPLQHPAVAAPTVVTTGQRVRAVWSRGAVELTVQARALGSAGIGERITLRTDSGLRLQGTAVEPGVVRIDGPGLRTN